MSMEEGRRLIMETAEQIAEASEHEISDLEMVPDLANDYVSFHANGLRIGVAISHEAVEDYPTDAARRREVDDLIQCAMEDPRSAYHRSREGEQLTVDQLRPCDACGEPGVCWRREDGGGFVYRCGDHPPQVRVIPRA